MAGSIVSEPLNPHSGFNWVFLVELLICGILTVFFLFYFNRLFATLVSYGIRAYTWHTYHAYIDIQALQISLLGGRIFFKDIRYHGHNETILVHGGYITWQYWIRRVKDADIHSDGPTPHGRHGNETPTTDSSRSGSRSRTVDNAEKGGRQTQKRLPCRISIKLSGVEAFMYNRSPAYDGIVDAIQRKANATKKDGEGAGGSVSEPARNGSVTSSVDAHGEAGAQKKKLRRSHGEAEENNNSKTQEHSEPRKTKPDDPPAFLRLLPIHIDCNKGAIVVGNEHTPSVITAQFDKASGEFDASSCGPLDVYQQVFNFQFTHPVVHMKPNPDFKAAQLETAMHLKQEMDHGVSEGDPDEKHPRPHEKRRSRWSSNLTNLSTLFSKSTESINTHPTSMSGKSSRLFGTAMHFPGQERWKGLTRYLDKDQDDGHGEWDGVEYARSSLIADCPCVNVSFYWDVTGPVPTDLNQSTQLDPSRPKDINGSIPPEYGMDIQIYGGVINYGPWADRHRATFQNIFFPGAHVDSVAATPLQSGESRVLTVFKLFLSIENDTVLRIPIRESSKDWKWKGKAQTLTGHEKQGVDKGRAKPRARKKSMRAKHRDKGTAGANVRPFAWIDVKIAGNSTLNYIMDMVAADIGYKNSVDVDIVGTEISSSVNHGLLWRSGAIGLDCDLSNPLSWNSLRKWVFNISCRDLELFLLRDHLFLLTDLVTDWGSGPPSDYFTFVPFQYLLNIDFTDFRLYLNTNDSNIVNNPSDLDDNNFIVLYGQRLHGDVTIPLDRFRPSQNAIRFDMGGQDMGMELCMPPKNSLNAFVRSKNVAKLGELTLSGSHTYMTDTSSMNTDRLYMDIQGSRLSLELYGFLVHHFMKIKDNYFGDDLHFKTLEEFQGIPSQSLAVDDTTPNGQPLKGSNDLDVIICVSADQLDILLPSNLYSSEDSLRIDLPYASVDLRFTNYYMDLMVDFSPLSISLGTSITSPGIQHDYSGQTEVFIESLTIFGHRLFGLPPTEPTYVCNWDFDVGRVSGECTSEFIDKAVGSVRSFAFTFDDDENSLPIADPLVIHDSTFLRLKTQDVHVWLHIAKEAVLLSTGPIRLDFNDLAGSTFSQRLSAYVPDVTLGAVDARSASRHRTRAGEKHTVETHAFLQTTLSLNMLKRKLGFTEDRAKQQSHMRDEDQRTNRTSFLILDLPASTKNRDNGQQGKIKPPAMQYPEIPHPIFLYSPQASNTGSSTSSGYSSEPVSTRGRQLRPSTMRSASTGSLTHSIRSAHQYQKHSRTIESSQSRTLLGRSPSRAASVEPSFLLSDDDERIRRNLPRSSLALSSSLANPYFPLDNIMPDLSNVPSFPAVSSDFDQDIDNLPVYNDSSAKHLDESFDHTSILISAEPGVRMYCTPEAVRCVASFIELIDPERPEDLLDVFQIDVMMKILNYQKRREGKGESIEFNVRIPFTHLRFTNEFPAYLNGGVEAGKDQYDLILNQLKLATRIKNFPGERAGENTTSLHTTLGSIGISATERSLQISNDDVAVQAEITDLLVWLMKGKETSINVSFRVFEAATASRKIQYLASLIHRTTLLAESLVSRFDQINAKQNMRLRYLTWFLTNLKGQYPDPAFLTRPSYALRAARDHLRSHDSWKIISRLRYVWQCLSVTDRSKLSRKCTKKLVDCPQGAEEKVISSWDQWRTWDLAHVKKSLAMKMVYGSDIDPKTISEDSPLNIDIRSAIIKLIIDPGPKQSEAALRLVAVNVALTPPLRPEGLMLVDTKAFRKSTLVQVSTASSSIILSWEISELVEVLVKMFQNQGLQTASNEPLGSQCLTPDSNKKESESHDFQVVYVADKVDISLDTVNLRSLSRGRRFRLSVVGSDEIASGQGETISVLAHLDQGVMELRSRSHLMLRSQFDYPSFYFTRHEHGNGDPDEIKIAGASRLIKVQMEEDVLGIIEAIDSVLRDEVAYVRQQTLLFQETLKSQAEPSTGPKRMAQLPNITVALLMDAYIIELALLQPLTWSISGSSGRISVVPTLGENVTLRIDYDLEGHTHRMYSSSMKRSNIISSMELPPVNGRLLVTNTETQTRIFASGIIETINLQASEIQALISTINKPEISTAVHAIKEDVAILKTHIGEIFPDVTPTPTPKTSSPSRDIVFGVEMTISGLNVVASAPGQSPGSAMANLAVRLACMQVKATNMGPNQTILALPEVIAHLQRISIEMSLTDADSIRRCGNLTLGATFQATAQGDSEQGRRAYRVKSSGLEVNMFADTASAVVDVMNHLQDKIKDLDLSKEKKYLRRLRHTKSRISHKHHKNETSLEIDSVSSGALFSSTYSLELKNIQISWVVGTSVPPYPRTESEDLVLSFRRIDLSTKKDDAARLAIEDMQLQMAPVTADKKLRSLNSALLPEVVFNVAYSSTTDDRKIAFQAAGKSLDLRLDSRFILPADVIERSIALAGKKFRAASATWNMTPTTSGAQRKNPFGNKRWASLLVDASFAGAVVHLSANSGPSHKESRSQQKGRYSQFIGDSSTSNTALRAPGVAVKVEYKDDGQDPSLNVELRVDGSNNTLYPTVVPLVIDISESIKEMVRDTDESEDGEKTAESQSKPAAKLLDEDNLITADPSAVLGRTRLNLGMRICKQEFSLSCQPIARVAAIAKLEDIYVTVNSVKSKEHGHFFAASAAFEKLEATVQHVYSRESTFGFDVDSIVLSLMNSKHLSGTSGISAILKVNPMRLQVNARQLQDFLLFREIWIPPEIRRASKPPATNVSTEPQEYLIQRYQQVTAATAFPWNANVAIADVSVELDLGQAIGKTSLNISNLWASSKKGTDWEQNLCIGVEKVAIHSSGRTSGFVELAGVKVRTSISWPSQAMGIRQTPLVQASLGFKQLRAKAGFDYQAFMVADIANFNFLMYNVREQVKGSRDRLVAILDGDKVHVFCTATSAAQGLALYQAIERLVQENQQAYKQSLKDIEKFLRRKSSVALPYNRTASQGQITIKSEDDSFKAPISLHTDVVVTLRSINVGVFPSTFVDSQIFMLEAADVQARFAVALEDTKIHSGLGMTLGQLLVALSPIANPKRTKPIGDLTVEDVVESARSARGGTILRVPKVIATMHTWQVPESNHIDYIFKSSFEGKVDVGWNYSRISYIRTMWGNHSRTLASRLGKPLPESAVKITSSAEAPDEPDRTDAAPGTPGTPGSPGKKKDAQSPGQEKITAVVNVPQSRYEYSSLEMPVIETPQLRDMGEATPPLEWIGLHRDRLPNVTHQIVIVTLLEVAREVEDAYGRILGNS
ncbi:hypothetical protein BCR34DRAFT_602374 [Clohesyomyces aquaticus]|uniref:Fermentation associated protein n=1 Tax=Clohesyomyces aquaticus TaxID=1231657 RepID=A0A1Y1ZIH4_9PLEO|nr:hypothetical protein BCR34DRAFT_602374 [Clohesyomyces aquaticus]